MADYSGLSASALVSVCQVLFGDNGPDEIESAPREMHEAALDLTDEILRQFGMALIPVSDLKERT